MYNCDQNIKDIDMTITQCKNMYEIQYWPKNRGLSYIFIWYSRRKVERSFFKQVCFYTKRMSGEDVMCYGDIEKYQEDRYHLKPQEKNRENLPNWHFFRGKEIRTRRVFKIFFYELAVGNKHRRIWIFETILCV